MDIALASVAAGRLDVGELRELVRGLAASPGDSLLLQGGADPATASGVGAPFASERPSALTSPAALARSLLVSLETERQALPAAAGTTAGLKPLGKAHLGRELRTPTRARKLLADWNNMKNVGALPAPGKKSSTGKGSQVTAKPLTPSTGGAPVSRPRGSGSPPLSAAPAESDKENNSPRAGLAGKGSAGLLKKGSGGGLRLSWKGKRGSENKPKVEALPDGGGVELRSESDEESFCGDGAAPQAPGLRQSWELDGSLAGRAGGTAGLESHDLFVEGASPSKNSLVLTAR